MPQNMNAVRIILSFLLAQQTLAQEACIACCLKGATGPPGISGFTGTPGKPGLPAIHGIPGFIGPPGLKGEQGLIGDIGVVGEKGEKGPSGLSGPEGRWDGDKGDIGEEGDQGNEGNKGNKGFSSSKGKKGNQGSTGDIGKSRVSKPTSFFAGYSGREIKAAENLIIVFNLDYFNTGNDYDRSNGKYTAPVSGTYFFSTSISQRETIFQSTSLVKLSTSQIKTYLATHYMSNDDEMDSITLSVIYHLDKGESVYVELTQGSSINIGESRIMTSTFTGYLIMDD
ncbi:uncharacterized protein [Antedon mediterranea]|uniref:uncharacterized protein isoform X2 n=1 Tax=Antedon mediterranea TaxID=105859 RepID=UPI003AF441FF